MSLRKNGRPSLESRNEFESTKDSFLSRELEGEATANHPAPDQVDTRYKHGLNYAAQFIGDDSMERGSERHSATMQNRPSIRAERGNEISLNSRSAN